MIFYCVGIGIQDVLEIEKRKAFYETTATATATAIHILLSIALKNKAAAHE